MLQADFDFIAITGVMRLLAPVDGRVKVTQAQVQARAQNEAARSGRKRKRGSSSRKDMITKTMTLKKKKKKKEKIETRKHPKPPLQSPVQLSRPRHDPIGPSNGAARRQAKA